MSSLKMTGGAPTAAAPSGTDAAPISIVDRAAMSVADSAAAKSDADVTAGSTSPGYGDGALQVEAHIRAVPDPEIPVISIDDLGIVREVVVDSSERAVQVTITPTYSGCPAMRAIELAIVDAAARDGFAAYVDTQLTPAWTTDWISESGRNALRRFGIAPPDPSAHATGGAVSLTLQRRSVACPVCGSTDTEELSRFGATACKALRRCLTCREPFEEFKPL